MKHDPIGSKTTALIRGGGYREYNQLKSNGRTWNTPHQKNKAAVSQTDSSRLIAIALTERQIVVEFGDRLPNRKMILYSVRWCDEIWRCEADNHA